MPSRPSSSPPSHVLHSPSGQRHILWLEGSADWTQEQARRLSSQHHWQQGAWLFSAEPPHRPSLHEDQSLAWVPAKQARQFLGQELDWLVIDTHAGLMPDALGVMAGTLKAGGWLLLLTPKDWAQQVDGDYRRLAAWPYQPEQLSHFFIAHCEQQLQQAAARQELIHWQQGQPRPTRLSASPIELSETLWQPPPSERQTSFTDEQAQVVQQLLAQLEQGQAAVLTAARGRGKSAALGLVALGLFTQRPEGHLLVSAPSAAAASELLHWLDQHRPATATVRFVAPDALLAEHQAGDWLLLDEAAALPIAQLNQLISRYPASLYATTLQGYEGSGRGFDLRFRAALLAIQPQALWLELHQPLRWAEADPLEGLIERLLLLQPAPLQAMPVQIQPQIAWITQAELAAQPALLHQVFSLLRLAHYRTRAEDLRQLLDGPDLKLALLCDQPTGALVGLAMIQQEGGFPADLADAIYLGQRRPQGHLLAQSLAFHAAMPAAAQLRWWRIQRLAIQPPYQGQRWGRQLMDWIQHQAAATEGIDALGSSFGATARLARFWQALGWQVLRLGMTQDLASGEPPLQMGLGLSPAGQQCLAQCTARFAERLGDDGPVHYAALDAELLRLILRQLPTGVWQAADAAEIHACAQGHRPLMMSLTALRRWLCSRLAQAPDAIAQDPAWHSWIRWLIQGHSWDQLPELQGLGRKAQEKKLRASLRSFDAATATHLTPARGASD